MRSAASRGPSGASSRTASRNDAKNESSSSAVDSTAACSAPKRSIVAGASATGAFSVSVAVPAGAGVLTWAKTNWLMTTYSFTAPFVVAQPQDATVTTGQSAVFTVVAGGSGPLAYQWYFNTNTPLPNATNSSFTLNNVQSTNGGTYFVIVTNLAGSATSTNALLNVSAAAPARPQMSGLVLMNGTFSLSVNGDSGHDYIIQVSTNLVSWDSLYTNHSPTPPFNWTDPNTTNFTRRFYRVLLGP